MRGTGRCRNQNRSSIQVDQPTSREKAESMVKGGCARGGNKTKEDEGCASRGDCAAATRFVSISFFGRYSLSVSDSFAVSLTSELCRICHQCVILLMCVSFFDFQCVCQVLYILQFGHSQIIFSLACNQDPRHH